MRPAPIPADEPERLRALREAGVLDTPPEDAFDDLTRIAAALCGAPIALVSLVDADRQWFKSRLGLDVAETPRDVAFCAHAILGPDLFVVRDARADDRFSDNPLVLGDPHVRFYAGAPLRTHDGHALGTLCVIDHVPRDLRPQQEDALRALANQVSARIELRRRIAELQRTVEERDRAEQALRDALAATRPAPGPPPSRKWVLPLAVAALAIPLALTVWGARASAAAERRLGEASFERTALAVTNALTERLGSYEQVVRGGQGLFAAREEVARDGWRRYVEALALPRRYPGILGLAYAPRVAGPDVPRLEAAARAGGIAGYAVHPASAWPDRFPVFYIEPSSLNDEALGFDLGSEARRRTAAERAAAAGDLALTARIDLVQDPEHAAGFLLFGPVYRRDLPMGTPADRRAALQGWVYAVFRARDVIGGLPIGTDRPVALQVFDGPAAGGGDPIYEGRFPATAAAFPPGGLVRDEVITIGGRPWTARISAPAERGPTGAPQPAFVLAGGLLASGLIFAIVLTLASTRTRALALVEERTRALSRSEQRVRAVMDAVGDAIVTVDTAGLVRSLNRAAEGLFAQPPSALVGRRLAELVPAITDGVGSRAEGEVRRADGTAVPVEVVVTALGGEQESRVAVLRDISERRQAEQDLRDSNDRTRSIIDNLVAGLLTVDETGVIESVNPAAERMFGYAQEELLGRHLEVLVPEGAAADRRAFLQGAFPRAIGRVTEWRGRRKDGREFPFELSMSEFRTRRGRHFAGSIRDLSEREQVERMKREFVSTVSHELRTPLTSIRGSLGLLTAGVLGELSDEAQEVVGIADRNCGRLIALINDILDLERLGTGALRMETRPVALEAVLARAAEAVQGFAGERKVPVEVAATPAVVQGDADRLVQVVVNLLSNAVKFSPPGSPVRVVVRAAPRAVRVEVVDRGRGVPAAHRESIFERFQQVESSDSREKGGTGLGLAICRTIVEQHGGRIGVESEEGRGSVFWFELPTGVAGDALLEALRASETGPCEVLLADSDPALLGVLARQLVGEGRRVRAALSAEEAIAAARAGAPRLVLLDLGLPDGPGAEVVAALRADPALARCALIVYTDADVGEGQRAGLVLGPTRFFTKSRARDAEVLDAVREMLEAAPAGREP